MAMMQALQESQGGVEKHDGGGWDIDLPQNLGGTTTYLSKDMFQRIRGWQRDEDPNFDVVMRTPAIKYAYNAVLDFKADRKENDRTSIPTSFAPVSTGPRAPFGAVKPVGLKPLITHQPQAAQVSENSGSPSSYTYASTSTTLMEIKPPSNCTIRDLTFSTSAADARLVSVTLNNVPIFSAGGSSGDGILLSELTSQNTRGAFLAGHEIGPDSKGLKLTFALPSTATVRAMCEHDTTLIGCTR